MNSTVKRQATESASNPTDMLIFFGKDGNKFFTNLNGEPYVCIDHHNSSKAVKFKSKTFRNYLMKRYYEETRQAPSPNAFAQAMGQLEADATFSGQSKPVELRVGKYAGKIYYDLHDGNGSVVEIDSTGYRITRSCPVCFSSSQNMPQRLPQKSGNLKNLLKHVRFKSKADKLLFLVYIVACFIPAIPHPVLIFAGEKVAVKSSSSRLTRSIVDPAFRDITSMPGGL